MNSEYINFLFSKKSKILEDIYQKEISGYYHIYGFSDKYNSMRILDEIDRMISTYKEKQIIIYNEISKDFNKKFKKLTFKEFILTLKLEKSLNNLQVQWNERKVYNSDGTPKIIYNKDIWFGS